MNTMRLKRQRPRPKTWQSAGNVNSVKKKDDDCEEFGWVFRVSGEENSTKNHKARNEQTLSTPVRREVTPTLKDGSVRSNPRMNYHNIKAPQYLRVDAQTPLNPSVEVLSPLYSSVDCIAPQTECYDVPAPGRFVKAPALNFSVEAITPNLSVKAPAPECFGEAPAPNFSVIAPDPDHYHVDNKTAPLSHCVEAHISATFQ